MTFNVSSWSIRHPTPAILLFIMLTCAGLMAFRAMKIQSFPDIDLPMVTVTAALPGASPTQIENDVARKLENVLATVQGVRHIRSTIEDGYVIIEITFQLEKPIEGAVDGVRDAVARVRSDLPAELRDPVIRKVEFAGSPILTYSIASPRLDQEALSWFVDREVGRTLLAVAGVGTVTRVGGANREIRIALDPARLLALNTTAAEISRQLRETQQEASGGRATLGGTEHAVRTVATVQSAAELAAIELTLSDGRRVRLDAIAEISDTVAEPRSIALLDGAAVVGFEVVPARGAGEISVADGVRAAIRDLRSRYPDMTITESINAVDPVIETYDGSMSLLYEGAILAVLVVFLFLRDGRATLVSALALPLSVIPTFAVMYLSGFSLNIVTLLSLSLVVGILVDDAIVEVENIERHLRMGKTPYRAAMDAAAEIGLAVITTTFALVAVFLPTAFMSGTVGRFFVQFGWTAAIAVIFSLLVARMLTPMMAAYLFRPPQRPERRPQWLRLYLLLARWCLDRRLLVVCGAFAFLVGGLALAATLPGAFIPAGDESRTQVTLTLPPGARLQDTRQVAEQARAILRDNSHVKLVYTAIGGGYTDSGPSDSETSSGSNVRTAVLTIDITPREQRPGVDRQQIEEQFRVALGRLSGVRVSIGTGDSSDKYVLMLSGQDAQALTRYAGLVERELRTIPGVGAVTSSAGLLRPELVVRPDFDRAADLGVTASSIAETLRVATTGDYDENLAKLNLSERQVPVVVRLRDTARDDLDTLARLPVPGARGPVPLGNVATLEMGSGPASISRYDRMRTIAFEVELNGRELSAVEEAAQSLPSLSRLPPGVLQTPAGDAEAMGELASGFGLAMLTGVLCIYMVLVLLLGDFVQPAVILIALALSIPGAFLALFITGTSLSMPSMIGLIMLMGIATKNSILLIDYIVIARRDHGLARGEAIMDACGKRARPIVMTTIAMGAGMVPIALGLGADPSFRAPMAIVVIGGLITSTGLSLLVVPVVYSYADDAVRWLVGRIGAVLPTLAAPREDRP